MYISNTSVTSGHIVFWAVGLLVIGAVYVLTDSYFERNRLEGGIVQPTELSVDSPTSKDFIGACSGMDMSNVEVHVVALSECMGRVRGFVDGHHLTVAMNQLVGVKSVNLWCMPLKTSSDQLLTNMMDWVDANPSEYAVIRSKVGDDNSATAVMIQALRTTYPCVNS